MRVCLGAAGWLGLSSLLLVTVPFVPAPAGATPVARPAPASGTVVSRASGEVVRFIAEPNFRDLVVGQDLLAGDLVRTGGQGALSLVFVNRTVMRLHPNSELLVREVTAASAVLALGSGLVWARTPRESEGTITVETPSAAAAIRGTDWSLAVEPGEVTRLTVMDGAAELSNALGAVRVPAGAAGVARPGQAPVLVQVANLREREQMLFTLTAPMAGTLLATAVERHVPPGTASRDFDDALARFHAGDFARAAAQFEAAAPSLAPETAAAARWIAAFARAAAGEAMAPPAAGGTLMDILGRAYLAAYSGDLDNSAAVLAEAGDHPLALSHAVEVALYRDRADEAERLLVRLMAIAAGTVEALSAEAEVERAARGNDAAAAGLYRRALAKAPGDAELWNDLALAEYGADRPQAAEAAVRSALALSPGAPHVMGNLAIMLLDQSRHAEARTVIDQILAADPGSYLGLRAAARLAIQEGREAEAIDLGLAALAAQPAAAESSMILAVAAWQAGDRVRALQELDAAGRLDPNDPIVPSVRTIIALDEARADDAIRAALETQRLYRQNRQARQLAADRASGSYVVGAFSNIGLEDWARDVADRTHDPLSAASLFSEALTPRPAIGTAADAIAEPIGSSVVQGLLLEPLGVAARVRDTDIMRRPFVDGELTGRWALGEPRGFGAEATVQGYANEPVPVALSLSLSGEELNFSRPNDDAGARNAVLLAGTQPGPRLGAIGILALNRQDTGVPGAVATPTPIDDDESDSLTAGAGFSLRRIDGSVLSGLALATLSEGSSDIQRVDSNFFGLQFDIDQRQEARSVFLGLGWRLADEGGTWFAGIEGARHAFGVTQFITITDPLTGNSAQSTLAADDVAWGGQAYLDRRWDLGGRFDVAAELGVSAVLVDDSDAFPLSPRMGIAATLAPGHRVRAGLVHETSLGNVTLSPVTVLGLLPLRAPLETGGETAAAIFRYDGTVGERLHLSLEHQTLRYEDMLFDVGDLLGAGIIGEARLHRTEVAANAWLGHGLGASASFAVAGSEILSGPARGLDVPTVAEREARFGLSWVHPAQIRASVEERYVGTRADDAGGELSPVWTTDAALSWEPLDKRLRLGVEARNIFDEKIERPFDQGTFGRSVWLSGSIRF